MNQSFLLKLWTSCIGGIIASFKKMKGDKGAKNDKGIAEFCRVKDDIDSELAEPAGASWAPLSPG